MVLVDHAEKSDAEFDPGNLVFLVIREKYFLVAHAIVGQRLSMKFQVEGLHVRYFGDAGQIGDRLPVRFGDGAPRQVRRVGQYRTQQQRRGGFVDLKAVIQVIQPDDGSCSADRLGFIDHLMSRRNASDAVMVQYTDDVRVHQALRGLGVFAVIDEEYGLARGILQHRRRFDACRLQYELGFMVHGAVGCRFRRIAQHGQQSGVGDGAANGVRVRAAVSDDVDGALPDTHVGDARPVQRLQPLQPVRPGIDSRIGRGIFFIDQAIRFLSGNLLALARRLAVAFQSQFIVSGRFCVILRFIRRQTRLEDVLRGEGVVRLGLFSHHRQNARHQAQAEQQRYQLFHGIRASL